MLMRRLAGHSVGQVVKRDHQKILQTMMLKRSEERRRTTSRWRNDEIPISLLRIGDWLRTRIHLFPGDGTVREPQEQRRRHRCSSRWRNRPRMK